MIRVLHLYPRELGINGDVGNVMALAKRAQWRGMPLEVLNHDVGSSLPEQIHLVHIGSGPVSEQLAVHADLLRIAPTLREWAAADVPFVAIAGGWQLLGHTLTLADGTALEGAGVFPTSTTLSTQRFVDEVWTPDAAGFENHSAATSGAPGLVLEHGPSVATNLHGPFLPMNPSWADRLLERAAALAGVPVGEPDERIARADDYAERSRRDIRKRLGL